MAKGKYIVIEGHDGTGKSTQVGLLRDRLSEQGIGSIEFHEPQGTPIADAIRTIIKNGTLPRDSLTNLLLFTAARHEIWKEAQKALNRGIWVIAARNYYSTLAYQGHGEGLDQDLILSVTTQFTDATYIHPDLAIILTLDDDMERERRIGERGTLQTPDTFEARDAVFQTAVKNGYLAIAKEHGLPTISAAQPVADIADEIYSLVERA
ncbi:dTMP kinase [Streptomyces caniscabiei]|uniref:dTMP kinase n=1 Tax=Streptomyces caniscabiei TaxID=2746961 RepID=UPI0029AEC889|nr:dTMP kinase [Streptomyces caniscabiei]MDX2776013.1 dTMP kinase [Streptomyces caniscabiei]